MKELEIKGLNEKIYYDTCDNGLKVFMWVKKNVNTFYGTLSVKYGSIYNDFKIGSKTYNLPKGVAHFLEHVKFNEDKDTTAHDFFFKHGCDTNAFTTFNYTNYQVLGSENPKDNIIHLLDFVQNGYFTKSIVSSEKKIITEEAKMGQDDPYTVMMFKHLDNIFTDLDHKYVITGTPDDIKKITLDDIKLVFNTFYHPENMFLVVTGNFNPYEIMEAVKENQNKKDFDKYKKPERIIKKESRKVRVKEEELNLNVTNRKIKIGLKMPKSIFKGYNDLQIRLYMALILRANFGATSDFKDELLEKELISSLTYMCDIFDDYVILMFTIDSDYKDEILKLFNNKISHLTMLEKTFERIKKANIASLILDYEDVEVVNSLIQSDLLCYDEIITDIKNIYEDIKYNDILKFIKCIDIKEKSILILNPLDNNK